MKNRIRLLSEVLTAITYLISTTVSDQYFRGVSAYSTPCGKSKVLIPISYIMLLAPTLLAPLGSIEN